MERHALRKQLTALENDLLVTKSAVVRLIKDVQGIASWINTFTALNTPKKDGEPANVKPTNP